MKHCKLSACLVLFIVTVGIVRAAERSVKDESRGALVWRPYSSPVQWQGGINSAGFAEGDGTLSVCDRQGNLVAVFKGTMTNGRLSGSVFAKYPRSPDRASYVGEFSNWSENGKGTMTYKNGKTATGQWRDGELVALDGGESDPAARPALSDRKPPPLGNGSGFLITSDGYFVTNNHVVVGAESVAVKFGNAVIPARVIKTDDSNDIAILKLEGSFPCLPLGEDLQVRPGEDVFTVGFPMTDVMGEAPKTTLGTINAITGMGDDPRTFQISVQIQPGNSGGPLVLKSTGNVIGVTSSSLNAAKFLRLGRPLPQDVNYAMKASYIRPLLATVPGLIDKLPKTNNDERAWREVQQEVEKGVGLVMIHKNGASPQTAPQAQPPPQTQSLWLFPDSSSRVLNRSELIPLNANLLWRARNEIYARNGLIFTTLRGKAFTASLGGDYRGVESDQDRVFAHMNKIEQANVELIKSIEQRKR